MLGGVFICYRREDSAGFARLIYDRLTSKLGRESVFFDVDNIPVGLDFVDILSERVGKCDALIAVIGKAWVSSADVHDRRRLDDPNDFVRIEIEAALERKIRVIPSWSTARPCRGRTTCRRNEEADPPAGNRDFPQPFRFGRRQTDPRAFVAGGRPAPPRSGRTSAREREKQAVAERRKRPSRPRDWLKRKAASG